MLISDSANIVLHYHSRYFICSRLWNLCQSVYIFNVIQFFMQFSASFCIKVEYLKCRREVPIHTLQCWPIVQCWTFSWYFWRSWWRCIFGWKEITLTGKDEVYVRCLDTGSLGTSRIPCWCVRHQVGRSVTYISKPPTRTTSWVSISCTSRSSLWGIRSS